MSVQGGGWKMERLHQGLRHSGRLDFHEAFVSNQVDVDNSAEISVMRRSPSVI